jgi:hypothetical protein
MILFAGVLMAAAGTVRYWQGWVFLGLMAACSARVKPQFVWQVYCNPVSAGEEDRS